MKIWKMRIRLMCRNRHQSSGLMMPVFVTSSIWNGIIQPDEEAVKMGENVNGRIKEVLSQLVTAIRLSRQTQKTNIISFSASFTKDGKSENKEVSSFIGPISKENKNPCITLFTPKDLDG